jgi:hypothetical protein
MKSLIHYENSMPYIAVTLSDLSSVALAKEEAKDMAIEGQILRLCLRMTFCVVR